MNLVLLISTVWFALFGIYTCAELPKSSTTPSPSSNNVEKPDALASVVGQERGGSLQSIVAEKKLDEDLNDHAGDHDQVQKVKNTVTARKGVTLAEGDNVKVATEVHANRNSSTDRASTTITKSSESLTNKTSETPSSSAKITDKVTKSDTASSSASEKNSSYESKSTKTGTSSSINSSKPENTSASSVTSKSKSSASTESTSKSSSINKKPLITYSVEDDPTLLNVQRVRQFITPLTPIDLKAEAADSAYLPPSSDFVLDRMQSKREMYIFPLVVLIFMVPMVLGVGIIILRRVRDYWSTRHYRRMDFLVDGMYNT